MPPLHQTAQFKSNPGKRSGLTNSFTTCFICPFKMRRHLFPLSHNTLDLLPPSNEAAQALQGLKVLANPRHWFIHRSSHAS